jgi:hypothetical protein
MTGGDGLDRSRVGSTPPEPDVARVNDVGRAKHLVRIVDGRFRVAFVLFGGMVVLQSSATLDASKIAYLLGTVLCVVGALAAVLRARRTVAVGPGTQWLVASAALAGLLAISFLVARAQGTAITDWGRDVAAYALFASAPVLALDGQASASRKLLVGMVVVAGVLGGLSWAIEWLSRRQIVDLPVSRLVFSSGQLPSLLYVSAMAMALTRGPRSGAWTLLAGLVLGLFLVTGTRSSLLLLVGPLAMAVVMGGPRIRSSLRALVGHAAAAAAVVVAFQLALSVPALLELGRTTISHDGSGPSVTFSPIVVGDRIGGLPSVVENPASDPSVKERVAQYEAAWASFVSSPIVGVGPGHSIDWVDVSGHRRSGFTADTPLVMPAKFGLLGILVFLGYGVAFASTIVTALRRNRRSEITLTLVGFGSVVFASLPLGFLVEDKGASLALMLLLALAFAESTAPLSIKPAPPDAVHAPVLEARRPNR